MSAAILGVGMFVGAAVVVGTLVVILVRGEAP